MKQLWYGDGGNTLPNPSGPLKLSGIASHLISHIPYQETLLKPRNRFTQVNYNMFTTMKFSNNNQFPLNSVFVDTFV